MNAWNRNLLPIWLLVPSGVARSIRRAAGPAPFRELFRKGPIRVGGAVATSAGRLPAKHLIHVAGINLLWMASERSIRDSITNAVRLAAGLSAKSLALPVIGGGSLGGRGARAIVERTLAGLPEAALEVTLWIR